jgi:lysophospholipase L1-like esterase
VSRTPDLVVVMIGANDYFAGAADGDFTQAEIETYRTNLVTIVTALRAGSPPPEIVLVGYYDLFDGLSDHALVPAAYRGLSAAVLAANELIAATAAALGCFYVGIHADFMHHAYGEALGDTQHLKPAYVRLPLAPLTFDIHPVTAGHRAICRRVYETLAALKSMPRITSFRVAAGRAVITWSAGFGAQYDIRGATEVAGAAPFSPLQSVIGFPPSCTTTVQLDTVSRRFFRVTETE